MKKWFFLFSLVCLFLPNFASAEENLYSINFEPTAFQYLYFEDVEDLVFPDTQLTIEGWLKFSELPNQAGHPMSIICRGGQDDDIEPTGFCLWVSDGTEGAPNVLHFYITDNGERDFTNHHAIHWATDIDFDVNTWQHFAVVLDLTTFNCYFYVNGIKGTTLMLEGDYLTNNQVFSATTTPAWIGYGTFFAPTSSIFDGNIDELRIWSINKTEFDIFETMTTEVAIDAQDLFGYYRFKGNYRDSTVNQHHLNSTSLPTFSTDVPFPGTVDYDATKETKIIVVIIMMICGILTIDLFRRVLMINKK